MGKRKFFEDRHSSEEPRKQARDALGGIVERSILDGKVSAVLDDATDRKDTKMRKGGNWTLNGGRCGASMVPVWINDHR